MRTVHCLENPVAARLHWQMEKWHKLGDLAMGGDQPIGHIVGMARHIANALQARNLVERPDQTIKTLFFAFVVFAAPCVDILPEQGDFPRTTINQGLGLIDQIDPWAGDF